MEALRELKEIVDAVFDSQEHAGIEAARREAELKPLDVYDLQVLCCECKRAKHLPAHVTAKRETIPMPREPGMIKK